MNYKFILLIPFLEIICFILSGDYLGFFLVILLIFVTGFLGFILVKSNINLSDIEKLINEPNEWLYKKIAGILLIIPGFVTDILGLISIKEKGKSDLTNEIMDLILLLRKNAKAKKDFEAADLIRDELNKLNIKIKDSREGSSWDLNDKGDVS